MLKLTVTVIAATLFATSFAEAGQYNQPQHLKVGSQAKVSRVIAKSRTVTATKKSDGSGTPACGEERDGVIVDRGVGKEKIVVVTKDIVNTGGNVEIGRECK